MTTNSSKDDDLKEIITVLKNNLKEFNFDRFERFPIGACLDKRSLKRLVDILEKVCPTA